ncbi:MAG: hypothetical protein R3E97_18155 [Candidatus Eisenbacteria bacterium]
MLHASRFVLTLGLGIAIANFVVACGNESSESVTSPTSGFSVTDGTDTPSYRVQAGPIQGPIDPVPIFIPFPDDLDYMAFLDDSSLELFGQTGMALTLDTAIGGVATTTTGQALFLVGANPVTYQAFSVDVDDIDFIENNIYEDPDTGDLVDVEMTWFYGTVKTTNGEVDAYMGAATASHPLLEEYYLVLMEPAGATAGRSSRDSGLHGAGGPLEFELDFLMEIDGGTFALEEAEEDPCDGCITAHNDARDKGVKRHKRCRRKALLYGGGATILASFGGPWGTAGGLLGTAAAIDACNDTLKDAKEDAMTAFCACWSNNGCDPNYSEYKNNCDN